MRTIIDLAELYIIVKILYKTFCLLTKKGSKKSANVLSKAYKLISRQIHHMLGSALKKQKTRNIPNIIELKGYKRKVH